MTRCAQVYDVSDLLQKVHSSTLCMSDLRLGHCLCNHSLSLPVRRMRNQAVMNCILPTMDSLMQATNTKNAMCRLASVSLPINPTTKS